MREARNERVANELLWRKRNQNAHGQCATGTDTGDDARANCAVSARAQTSDMQVQQDFPAQYTIDDRRIENNMFAEELGLHQPTRKERLKASYVRAILEKNYSEARRVQDELDHMAH